MISLTLFKAYPKQPIYVKASAIESFYATERGGGELCTRITLTGSTIFDVVEAPAEILKKISESSIQVKLDDLRDAIQDDLENGVAWLNDQESELFVRKYPRITAAHNALLA